MSDRIFEMVDHRYPWGHFAYPAVANVVEAPFHESTTPQDRLLRPPDADLPFTATDPITRTRRCRVCHEWKAFEAFHRDANNTEGIVYTCKACRRVERRTA